MRKPIAAVAILSCCALVTACAQRSIAPSLPPQLPAQAFDVPSASAAYSVLYSFKGQPDGQTPNPDLIEANGALYGTTSAGGTANFGTIFKITTGGSEAPVYSFAGGTGSTEPDGGV